MRLGLELLAVREPQQFLQHGLGCKVITKKPVTTVSCQLHSEVWKPKGCKHIVYIHQGSCADPSPIEEQTPGYCI